MIGRASLPNFNLEPYRVDTQTGVRYFSCGCKPKLEACAFPAGLSQQYQELKLGRKGGRVHVLNDNAPELSRDVLRDQLPDFQGIERE